MQWLQRLQQKQEEEKEEKEEKEEEEEGVTRAVFSSSAGREVATAADKKISSDETKLSVDQIKN